MRRRLLAGSALTLAAGALVLMPATTAGAVDSLVVGSWSTAGTKGMHVSSDPSGQTAVSAVRFNLAQGESAPVLTLTVDSNRNPQAAPISACITNFQWQPVDGGPFASRPAPDCGAGIVHGELSSDGKQMTFGLSDFVRDGLVNVVLFDEDVPSGLPAPLPATAHPIVDVSFQQPTPASVAVQTEASPDAGATAGTDFAPLPTEEPAASYSAPAPEPLPASVYSPAPAATTPTPARRQVAAPPATTPLAVNPLRPIRDKTDVRNRLIAGLVFVDLVGLWWWWSYRQPARAATGAAEPRPEPRPHITLHDDPAIVLAQAEKAGRLRRTPRGSRGTVPALR